MNRRELTQRRSVIAVSMELKGRTKVRYPSKVKDDEQQHGHQIESRALDNQSSDGEHAREGVSGVDGERVHAAVLPEDLVEDSARRKYVL